MAFEWRNPSGIPGNTKMGISREIRTDVYTVIIVEQGEDVGTNKKLALQREDYSS